MPTAARQTTPLVAPNATGSAQAARRPAQGAAAVIDPELRPALLDAQYRPPARAAAPANAAARKTNWWRSPAALFAAAVTALLILGWFFPTELYITPKRGIGYALGIIGGSLMLLLFLYSARKHFPWLKFMGATASWFRFHMVLGVLGPLCILYHANFGLGATNSNVALISMLIVAGSGLVGRYIYARIHHGLYGSKLTLGELRKGAEALRSSSKAFAFLPELVSRLDQTEQQLLSAAGRIPVLGVVRLTFTAVGSWRARWALRRYVRKGLRAAAARSSVIAGERRRLRRAAFGYIDRRLAATRRVAGFEAYERLFSLWHALHLPLIFMMLIAGTVHVIAVHVY